MTTRNRIFALSIALFSVAGCASHDHQDMYLLGEANSENISMQSVRDVNLPNSKAVEFISGVRAANAVKALNEGRTRELREASAGETEGS